MVLWAFSNLVVQSEAQTLYDWISEPDGVRAEGRISLGGCQRNRVQASRLMHGNRPVSLW